MAAESVPLQPLASDEISLGVPLVLPCGVKLPNRLVKAAMTECLADGLSRPTPELFRLYETWSRGGTGLLITGNVQIDRRYLERPGNVCIDGPQTEEQIELLKKFALSGQKYNASKIFVQLSHAGRQCTGMVNMSPIGPGTIEMANMPKGAFGKPKYMTLEAINDVKERFVNAAKVCKQCGFDGIQIHAAHGYLISSFMNPNANNRLDIDKNDKYGGSLENRCRLLLEIVNEVRNEVGDKYAIAVKLNSADFQKGGFTADECIKVALFLEKAGIDLLELSGGNYESNIFREGDIEGKEAELDAVIEKYNIKRSTALREAYYLKYSRDVINALKTNNSSSRKNRMCIMTTGGFRSKQVMLEALNTGGCDLIGVGRPLCGKPDGSMELIQSKDNEYSLPRFEGTLVVGLPWIYNNFINNPKWYGTLPMLGMINFIAKQYWYYMQIIMIGRTGKVDLKYGCFKAMFVNAQHEQKCAEELIGIKAVGSIYNKNGSVDNPPIVVKKKKGGSVLGKVALVLVIGISAYYYKYYYSQNKTLDLNVMKWFKK